MSSRRMVKSPAGQDILVFEDEAWAQATGLKVGTDAWGKSMSATTARLAPLAVLWRDGPIENPYGLATTVLIDLATELDEDASPNLTQLLGGSPVMRRCVERATQAKRTYSIRLVALPARWLPQVEVLARRRTPSTAQRAIQTRGADTGTGVPRQAPVPARPATNGARRPVEAAPAVLEPSRGSLDSDVASAVATALLAQVVEVLSKGTGGPQEAQLRRDLDSMAERLGTQVDYVGKLRRDLRASGDEVLALRQERDGLRERLRQTEANLKAATSQDAQRIIDAEVQRQLDRMMREKPANRSALDADLDHQVEAVR